MGTIVKIIMKVEQELVPRIPRQSYIYPLQFLKGIAVLTQLLQRHRLAWPVNVTPTQIQAITPRIPFAYDEEDSAQV